MITNQSCWFYEQTVNNHDLFPGAYKPHLCWIQQNELILLFFIEKNIPKTIIFDCNNSSFEKTKTLDFSLLNVPSFDFHIQKVFFYQNRLLLVKNTLQSDKTLLLVSNNSLSKIYPIKLDLPCDFIHNGITLFDACLFFFGGVNFETMKCHSKFYKLDLCQLRFTEIILPLGSELPSPLCNPFIEMYNNEIFLAGGFSDFPFYEGWKTSSDVWFFNFKNQCWKNFNSSTFKFNNIKNIARDKDRVCIVTKSKNYELHVIHMERFTISTKNFANVVWIPPGV